MKSPIFITGNQHKVNYLAKLLDTSILHQKVDLDEIQSTRLEEIVTHKVKQAYDITQSPVLVEDVSMGFAALHGLPGPFIKFFIEPADGLEHLCRMLDGLNNRSARAECMFGYYDGNKLELIQGGLGGVIADHPRGDGGFGWDSIFCPDGYDGKTRAELSHEQYNEVYRMIKPIDQLKNFLYTL